MASAVIGLEHMLPMLVSGQFRIETKVSDRKKTFFLRLEISRQAVYTLSLIFALVPQLFQSIIGKSGKVVMFQTLHFSLQSNRINFSGSDFLWLHS